LDREWSFAEEFELEFKTIEGVVIRLNLHVTAFSAEGDDWWVGVVVIAPLSERADMLASWDVLVDDRSKIQDSWVGSRDVELEVLPITLELEGIGAAIRSDRHTEDVRVISKHLDVCDEGRNYDDIVGLRVWDHVACALIVSVVRRMTKQALSQSECSGDRVELNLFWKRGVRVSRQLEHRVVVDRVSIADVGPVGVRCERRDVDLFSPDKHLVINCRCRNVEFYCASIWNVVANLERVREESSVLTR